MESLNYFLRTGSRCVSEAIESLSPHEKNKLYFASIKYLKNVCLVISTGRFRAFYGRKFYVV